MQSNGEGRGERRATWTMSAATYPPCCTPLGAPRVHPSPCMAQCGGSLSSPPPSHRLGVVCVVPGHPIEGPLPVGDACWGAAEQDGLQGSIAVHILGLILQVHLIWDQDLCRIREGIKINSKRWEWGSVWWWRGVLPDVQRADGCRRGSAHLLDCLMTNPRYTTASQPAYYVHKPRALQVQASLEWHDERKGLGAGRRLLLRPALHLC